MQVTIHRLWHGYASVRDYQVKEAYDKKEDLVIVCNNESMRIPHKELLSGSISGQKIKSLHINGFSYHLIDYPWRKDAEQQSLL